MSSLMTTIRDNTIGGDAAGGDVIKTYHAAREPTSMSKLVEQYRAETQADHTLLALTEKLEHFFSNQANEDVRGLEEKLSASGRSHLLKAALFRKQSAAKAIMRHQGSRSAQSIYTFLMAEIVVNFEHGVLPLVQAEVASGLIDAAMLEKVISPALQMLEDNPLGLDKLDIQGLVYFLAGNCYVRWDAC